ncbi:MAG: AbrB/MazE/SpoVT family DNA-binding domain-containing protein [Chloroflexota bacterium]|nr:MAG: AbrB family transcriptional regulator [Chloroflexota bacterium]
MDHVVDTTVTQKGQVTIPAGVRRAMGLQPRDHVRIEWDAEHGVAILRRAPLTIADLYGAVRAPAQHGDESAMREHFERGVAEEVLSETQ